MNKKNIFNLCILIAYFTPSVLMTGSYASIISSITLLVKIIVTVYYIPKVLIESKFNKIDLLVILFLISQVISAQVTNTLYLNYLGGQFFLFGFYFYLKYSFLNDSKSTLQSLYTLFISFVIIQVITQLIFQRGFNPLLTFGDYREYFLGRKNVTTPYLLIAFESFYLLNKKMDRFVSIKEFAFIVLFGILSILTDSSTTIICYLLFMILRIAGLREKLGRVYPITSIIIYLFISLSIVFSQSAFLSVVTSLFGKNATFSGRTNIWQLAIRVFENNFWFGGGLDINFNAWTNGVIVNSAHNTLLDILSRYGLFSGIFFGLIIISLFIGKYRVRSKILLTTIISFLMFMMMENSPIDILLLIVAISVYWPMGQEKINEQNNESDLLSLV